MCLENRKRKEKKLTINSTWTLAGGFLFILPSLMARLVAFLLLISLWLQQQRGVWTHAIILWAFFYYHVPTPVSINFSMLFFFVSWNQPCISINFFLLFFFLFLTTASALFFQHHWTLPRFAVATDRTLNSHFFLLLFLSIASSHKWKLISLDFMLHFFFLFI